VDPLLTRVGDDPALRVSFDLYCAKLAIQSGHTAEAGRVLTALSAQLLASDGPREFRGHAETMQSELALAERDPARAIGQVAEVRAWIADPSAP